MHCGEHARNIGAPKRHRAATTGYAAAASPKISTRQSTAGPNASPAGPPSMPLGEPRHRQPLHPGICAAAPAPEPVNITRNSACATCTAAAAASAEGGKDAQLAHQRDSVRRRWRGLDLSVRLRQRAGVASALRVARVETGRLAKAGIARVRGASVACMQSDRRGTPDSCSVLGRQARPSVSHKNIILVQ